MAGNPPGVLRLAKESIYRSLNSDLETAFARETEVQMECFYSEDFLEGVTPSKRSENLNSRAVNMKFILIVTAALLLAGCNQNMEVVKSGETLENSPKIAVDPNAKPLPRPRRAKRSSAVRESVLHAHVG